MRARDVVGKRIVSIDQERYIDPATGSMGVSLQNVWLDDGTRIYFIVDELTDGYAVRSFAQSRKEREQLRELNDRLRKV